MARTRPPGQLYRPRPQSTRKTKDPLGEELGDYRERIEDEHTILPDSWFTPEKPPGPEVLPPGYTVDFINDGTTEAISLTDELKADVRRKQDPFEDYWQDQWGIPGTPFEPTTPEHPDVVQPKQVFEENIEALRANDKVEVVIDTADKNEEVTRYTSVKNLIIDAVSRYHSANTWRYEPRLWFRHPTRRNICEYVERRDHKGSGNRKGKKRGLAEQQQIKLWYLCRG